MESWSLAAQGAVLHWQLHICEDLSCWKPARQRDPISASTGSEGLRPGHRSVNRGAVVRLNNQAPEKPELLAATAGPDRPRTPLYAACDSMQDHEAGTGRYQGVQSLAIRRQSTDMLCATLL